MSNLLAGLLALLLSGCGDDKPSADTCEPSDSDVHADSDTDTDSDTDSDDDIEDVLDALPDCEPVDANDRVDLVTGCADDACASMTLEELNAALGEDAVCTSSTTNPTVVYCDWPVGMWCAFDDLDEDEEPDTSSTAGTLYLEAPYDGGTGDGLGPGASFSCFIDALGYPNSVYFWDLSGTLEPFAMSWFDWGVFVSDPFGTGTAESMGISGVEDD